MEVEESQSLVALKFKFWSIIKNKYVLNEDLLDNDLQSKYIFLKLQRYRNKYQ
jgi:hypothetical protein